MGSIVGRVLDGIRVVDFSRVFAGPAAGQALGDLGADVVKVEEPDRGDEARYLGLTEGSSPRLGVSPSFLALNRNKRSIGLDLGAEAGREVALRMITRCDVVIHNFRPGAMQRWGLSYEAVREANPGLVFCEFFSYGPTGPLSDVGANDLALQAHSGLMSLTGEPGRPPVRVGTAAIDLHGSLAMVASILAALFHRERTGKGQRIETSLLLASAHLMNYFYSEYWIDNVVRTPMGTANHLSVPNQVFPTSDGSIVIIAPSDEMWRRCARALDGERLDRPEYASITDRQTRRGEIIDAISAVTRRMTSDQALQKLGAARVNVAKVQTVAEAADHPQLADAGGIARFDFEGESVKSVATPFRLTRTPTDVRYPPPWLDEHRSAILSEYGFGEAEAAALAAAGAFGSAARRPGADARRKA